MKIEIKRLTKNVIIPAYETTGSAAVDLRANITKPIKLDLGEVAMIPTGIAINIHDVEAETGEALGSLANSDFDTVSAHLGMALSASQRDDEADVEHHLGSAAQAAANHDHQTEMEQMLADWYRGDKQHDVVDRMYEMLGLDHSD